MAGGEREHQWGWPAALPVTFCHRGAGGDRLRRLGAVQGDAGGRERGLWQVVAGWEQRGVPRLAGALQVLDKMTLALIEFFNNF